jgi:hypothetical protein
MGIICEAQQVTKLVNRKRPEFVRARNQILGYLIFLLSLLLSKLCGLMMCLVPLGLGQEEVLLEKLGLRKKNTK